jgi:hypothetical protein
MISLEGKGPDLFPYKNGVYALGDASFELNIHPLMLRKQTNSHPKENP